MVVVIFSTDVDLNLMLSLDYLIMNYSSKYKKKYVKKNFYKKKKKKKFMP